MPAPRISGREKWKYKKWFTVVTPPVLGEVPVAVIPADSPEKALGRTIEITLYDLFGDISQLHMRFILQISEIDGDIAKTVFKQFHVSRDYLRSLTKRKSSKVTLITNLTTKDNARIRVTAMVFTTFRCKTSQKKAIRRIIYQVLSEVSKQLTVDELIQSIIQGKIQMQLHEASKKIYPIRRAEIAKIKILSQPKAALPQEAVA